jgi:hypothetical protein
VIRVPDKEVDQGGIWEAPSTESYFQDYRSKLPPAPLAEPALAPSPQVTPAAALPPAKPDFAPLGAPVAPRNENPGDAGLPAGSAAGVSIQSEPSGARAEVDNTATCVTPCLITLAPGPHHTLRMQLAGYRDALRIFEVPRKPPIPPVSVTLDPKRGWLEVDSDPAGAPVILDGRPTDKRTPATFQLPEGEHVVGIEVDGKIRSEKIAITDNGMAKVRF